MGSRGSSRQNKTRKVSVAVNVKMGEWVETVNPTSVEVEAAKTS